MREKPQTVWERRVTDWPPQFAAYFLLNPFNASWSKLLLFEGFTAIGYYTHYF